jgi:hypothetical protein
VASIATFEFPPAAPFVAVELPPVPPVLFADASM